MSNSYEDVHPTLYISFTGCYKRFNSTSPVSTEYIPLAHSVSPETRQTALPLLLQWEGHSVSVVGVARSRGGDESLLVLDPALAGAYLTSRMKRPSTSFTAAAYQFAYLDVAGGVLVGDAEREEGKVVSSELVLVWRDRVEGRGGI